MRRRIFNKIINCLLTLRGHKTTALYSSTPRTGLGKKRHLAVAIPLGCVYYYMDTVQQAKLLVEEMSGEERVRYLRELLKDHGVWEYVTVCEFCTKLAINLEGCSAGGPCPRCARMTCDDCGGLRCCCDNCVETGRWKKWWKKCHKRNPKRRREGRKMLEKFKGPFVCRECLAEICPYCPTLS